MKIPQAVLSYVLWTSRSSRAFLASAANPRRSLVTATTTTKASSAQALLGPPTTAAATCPWNGRGGACSAETTTRLQSTTASEEDTTTTKPVEIFRTDYRPLPYTVRQVEMAFDIHDGRTVLHTAMTWQANPMAQEKDQPVVLDGDETSVTLQSVALNGKTLAPDQDYVLKPGQMELKVPIQDGDKLETVVEIVPEENTQLSGLYKSGYVFSLHAWRLVRSHG